MKNELVTRWKSKSPKFFKKLTNVMVSIGAISVAIVTLPATLPIALPAALVTVAGYGIAVGTVGATVSKLTKE